jgi:hypothetical protein
MRAVTPDVVTRHLACVSRQEPASCFSPLLIERASLSSRRRWPLYIKTAGLVNTARASRPASVSTLPVFISLSLPTYQLQPPLCLSGACTRADHTPGRGCM